MCKVSVLTPVYNVEKYLRQCLDSLAAQTLTDIEFICINDGSTDSSLAILRDYEARDARFRIIDKPNSGYGDSMNAGLRAARGEYIGIVESDDFAEPDMFARLYEAAADNAAELVRSNFYNHWEGIEEKEELLQREKYAVVFSPEKDENHLFEYRPYIWSSLYQREFLLQQDIWFNPTPGASYQDFSFNYKVLACAQRVYLLSEAFLHYRRDNESSSMNSRAKVYCMFDEYAEMKRFLQKKGKLHGLYGSWLAYKIFSTGLGNFGRVALDYKALFWERLMEEFAWCEREGLFRRALYTRSQWIELADIMENSRLAFAQRYTYWQREQAVRERLERELREKRCFVYGAGVIGRAVVAALLKRGLTPDGIVVSSTENNPSAVYGIKVCALDGLMAPADETVFVLGLKGESQYEVMLELAQRGYRNFIYADREVLNALR